MEKLLEGYSKSFMDFITRAKSSIDIDDKIFESLLPSKELISEDEKKYDEYRKICDCDKHTHLDMPFGDLSSVIQYPISYYYAYDLLDRGVKGLERYPEEPYYRIRRFYWQDGIEQKEEKILKASFTKLDFLLDTEMCKTQVSKKLIRKK